MKLKNYKNNDKVGEVIVKLDKEEIFRENIFVRLKKKNKETFFNKIKNIFKKVLGEDKWWIKYGEYL